MIIGVATTWSKSKGLDDYILLRKVLSSDYQIALIGVNNNVRDKLPDNIICLPKTDSIEKLAFIYSIADVVTSLSYAESLGMTPIEGLACGTPAIVYDNTAQPELIDEQCGQVVPTGNVEALKVAVEIVRTNGNSYYSKACVTRANKFFDKDKRYSDYINLYKELCGQKN